MLVVSSIKWQLSWLMSMLRLVVCLMLNQYAVDQQMLLTQPCCTELLSLAALNFTLKPHYWLQWRKTPLPRDEPNKQILIFICVTSNLVLALKLLNAMFTCEVLDNNMEL